MLADPIANALSKILNYELIGRREVLVHPTSKVLRAILTVLNEHNYVGLAEELTPKKGGVLKVNLLGSVNKCGVVKPRFSVTITTYEKFEKRYLPAKGVGILVVSTPQGIMSHEAAKAKKIGGRLLAYCY